MQFKKPAETKFKKSTSRLKNGHSISNSQKLESSDLSESANSVYFSSSLMNQSNSLTHREPEPLSIKDFKLGGCKG